MDIHCLVFAAGPMLPLVRRSNLPPHPLLPPDPAGDALRSLEERAQAMDIHHLVPVAGPMLGPALASSQLAPAFEPSLRTEVGRRKLMARGQDACSAGPAVQCRNARCRGARYGTAPTAYRPRLCGAKPQSTSFVAGAGASRTGSGKSLRRVHCYGALNSRPRNTSPASR